MAYRDSYGGGFGGTSMTPWVKRLLIANTAVFLAVFVLENIARIPVMQYLAFRPRDFLTTPWTILTYSFVHAGIWHLLGNLLVLYFFGAPLENRWGSRDFIRFYLVAVAGGALFSVLFFFMQPSLAIVGASAGTFGLMAAFAMIWPDMEIQVWGIFPIKAKYFVGILAAINVMMLWTPNNGIAVLAHLGGLVAAIAWLKSPWAPSGWGDVPSSPRGRTQQKRAAALVPWTAKKPTITASSSAGTATQTRPAPARSAKAERELLDDVDRILDKISANGLASLTDEERKRLDEVSRRYRTN
jgi:membrane associated rhomboid family serine protease